MADAKLTALTAAGALAAADLFYVSQSAASRKATGTQLLALVGTAYVPLAGGTMTGALTLPAGTVSAPSLNVATSTGLYRYGASNLGFAVDGLECAVLSGSALYLTQSGASIQLTSTAAYGFSSGSAPGTSDVRLYRDAAATLAQRNGTTQQIFRLYNSYTDPSNYERLTLTGVAGTSVNITAETLGTGGDNLDIVLTPAGTGSVLIPGGAYDSPGLGFAAYPGTGIWAGSADYMYVLCNLTSSLFLGATRAELGTSQIFGWSSVGGAGQASADTALSRNAAGVVEVNSGTAGTYRDLRARNLITNPGKFAALVDAATAGKGARAFINDGAGAVFGVAAAGGGANNVPVYSDGTNWIVG